MAFHFKYADTQKPKKTPFVGYHILLLFLWCGHCALLDTKSSHWANHMLIASAPHIHKIRQLMVASPSVVRNVYITISMLKCPSHSRKFKFHAFFVFSFVWSFLLPSQASAKKQKSVSNKVRKYTKSVWS